MSACNSQMRHLVPCLFVTAKWGILELCFTVTDKWTFGTMSVCSSQMGHPRIMLDCNRQMGTLALCLTV